jgi:hypothetical protein
MAVGGLATDVKVAGRWGIVSGDETNSVLNAGNGPWPAEARGRGRDPEHGRAARLHAVMTDATRATTYDDLGTDLNIFDTATNRFVYRYVDFERDRSILAVPGEVTDLGDHEAGQKIIRGSGAEQIAIRGDLLFVSQLHSDKVDVFRINRRADRLCRQHADRRPTNHIAVLRDTHGRTSYLSAADIDALGQYLRSLQK